MTVKCGVGDSQYCESKVRERRGTLTRRGLSKGDLYMDSGCAFGYVVCPFRETSVRQTSRQPRLQKEKKKVVQNLKLPLSVNTTSLDIPSRSKALFMCQCESLAGTRDYPVYETP